MALLQRIELCELCPCCGFRIWLDEATPVGLDLEVLTPVKRAPTLGIAWRHVCANCGRALEAVAKITITNCGLWHESDVEGFTLKAPPTPADEAYLERKGAHADPA